MKRLTRERPTTDRIACPWQTARFIGLDDLRQLERSLPVYDAPYAWCRQRVPGLDGLPA